MNWIMEILEEIAIWNHLRIQNIKEKAAIERVRAGLVLLRDADEELNQIRTLRGDRYHDLVRMQKRIKKINDKIVQRIDFIQ